MKTYTAELTYEDDKQLACTNVTDYHISDGFIFLEISGSGMPRAFTTNELIHFQFVEEEAKEVE